MKSFLQYFPSYTIVGILIVLVYWKTIFESDFVYDDRPAILSNDDVLGHTPWFDLLRHDFWGNPINLTGSHKSFRPFTIATFRLQAACHGLNHPSLFHVINVIFHFINSILVKRLAAQLGLDEKYSLISTICFSLHPICTEAVSSIVGRADLISATCLLLALVSSQNTALTMGLAAIGLLAKETSIITLPLVFLYRQKKTWRNLLEFSTFLAIICYIRLSVNNFQSPRFSKLDNPIAYNPSLQSRTLTFFYLPVFHLSLILYPKTLCFDWSISPIHSISDYRVFISLIVYITLTIWIIYLIRQKSHTILFLMSLLILPHLISSNLFTYVGFQAAERILYIPSISFSILIGYGAKKANVSIWIIMVLVVIYSARTMQRVEDWTSEENLFKSALSISPVRSHANIGHVYAAKNDVENAKNHYFEALRRNPNMADTWYNLGVLTSKINSSEAIFYYEQALKFRNNFAAAHLNLAILFSEGNPINSRKVFKHLDACIYLSGENLKSYQNHQKMIATCAYNKGRILVKFGEFEKAITVFKLALQHATPSFEHFSSILTSLGSCYSNLNQFEIADKYLQDSMRINRDHLNTYLVFAQLRLRQNRSIDAGKILSEAKQIAPTSPIVLHHLARHAQQSGDYNRSLELYRQALEANPGDSQSLRGIADLLRETERFQEAVDYYLQISRIEPNSAEAFTNLGAIYHLNRKYNESLKAYDRALGLSPNDKIANENRRKLIRAMRQFG